MNTTTQDYITKDDLREFETKIIYEMRLMVSHLSRQRQLTVEVRDTLWKLVPIMFGLMTLVNAIFFIAYKWG
jgi:hypothetical protein